MKIKNSIVIVAFILCILFLFPYFATHNVHGQYPFYDYSNYFNLNRYTMPYNTINSVFSGSPYSFFNQSSTLLPYGLQTPYQSFMSTSTFGSIATSFSQIQGIRYKNNSNSTPVSFLPSTQFGNFSPFRNLMSNVQYSTIFSSTLYPSSTPSTPLFNTLFIDPLQPTVFSPVSFFNGNSILPLYLTNGNFFSSPQTYQHQAPVNNAVSSEALLTEKIMTMADTFTVHVLSLTDKMSDQMEQFQVLALQTTPHFAETLEEFMQNAIGWTSGGGSIIESVLPIAAEFAEKGMEMGYLFAKEGMELGFQFAIMGEEVGPMANRLLFMATQIGVMADRIGEMADRILFMSDNIGEFGDKIIYVSQLIVYTEELMVNVSVLINETIRTISDMLLTMLAISTNNDTYLQLRAELMASDNNHLALTLIYENMNRMLDHMLEYSLQVLKNEAAQNENELIIRELQLQLREITQSANSCFCPGFCVDPNQCITTEMDPDQWAAFFADANTSSHFCTDPNHCISFSKDPNDCINLCFDPNHCINFCL